MTQQRSLLRHGFGPVPLFRFDWAEILADFPQLDAVHIQAVLAFAAEREQRLADPHAV